MPEGVEPAKFDKEVNDLKKKIEDPNPPNFTETGYNDLTSEFESRRLERIIANEAVENCDCFHPTENDYFDYEVPLIEKQKTLNKGE